MAILDSGSRTEFESGAVRDMKDGKKGRCDLLPLDVCYRMTGGAFYSYVNDYIKDGYVAHLYGALNIICDRFFGNSYETMILELSHHFQDGAEKYGIGNWQKGIPEWSYIDSAVRHYTKAVRGDDDERHDRACAWNIVCLIWTHEHMTNSEEKSNA